MGNPQDPQAFEASTDAAAAQGADSIGEICAECQSNWIKIRYEYADGTGVPGASYVVQTVTADGTPTGKVLAEGRTDDSGDAHVVLPDEHTEVEFYFYDDPEGEPYEDPEATAPIEEPEEGFFARLWDDITEAGDWVLGVLQGDFNEDASTSQIITRMILTMIPGIDQLADAQDIIHILYRLIWKREWDVPAHWILLVITLIGLIPTFGSLAKGVLKMVLKKAGDISALRALYDIFNFFNIGNAHRWLTDFARRLTGDILDWVVRELDILLSRAADHMAWAKTRILGDITGWNRRLDDGIARVNAMRGVATGHLREAATTLQRKLLDTLATAMTRIQRKSTRNAEPHVVKQNVETPPARVPNANASRLRSDMREHMELRDPSVPRRRGIGGAHEKSAFEDALSNEGGEIVSRTPHPTIPGVEQVEYRLAALGPDGTPTGAMQSRTFNKTIYDSSQLPTDDLLRMGQEAADDALMRNGGALPREFTGTTSDGILIRGYSDTTTGEVTSFFPDI